jgi:hypothetical protein
MWMKAVQKLGEMVKADYPSYPAEAVVRFVGKTPGWKESNFQVGFSLCLYFMKGLI